ncbi:MAG: hypothetical protein H6Q72_4696 [Firmicutes bacterium]|nr:hypothetical protein [Bacillota bacterium]
MKQKEIKNELDVLLPESDVVVNGETITIKPFLFAELPKMVKLLAKMGAGIYELFGAEGLKFSEQGNVIINQALLDNIGTVIEDHFPEVVELIAIYTGKTPDFYTNEENGFNAEDGILLLAKIIERNYDFFMRRLASELTVIKAKQK